MLLFLTRSMFSKFCLHHIIIWVDYLQLSEYNVRRSLSHWPLHRGNILFDMHKMKFEIWIIALISFLYFTILLATNSSCKKILLFTACKFVFLSAQFNFIHGGFVVDQIISAGVLIALLIVISISLSEWLWPKLFLSESYTEKFPSITEQ